MEGEPEPRFFATPAALGRWLARNHAKAEVLWVGYRKVGSGKKSITWPESVDEALCWGWIDGVRRSIDEASYAIRFTPRKPDSVWSAVNLRRVEALLAAGRMAAPGRAAFEARTAAKKQRYSYEQRGDVALPAEALAAFRADAKAWAYFEAQPPWYRRTAVYWVVSAKKEETRARRLATLIADSRAGRPIKELARKKPGA